MVPIQGVYPARVLTRVQTRSSLQLTSPQGHIACEIPRNCAYVMITNFSDLELTVLIATVLSIAEAISEAAVDKINREGQSSFDVPTEAHSCEKNKALFQKLLKGKLNHLPPHERQLIEPVLAKYAHVFHDEELNDFKATNVVENKIPVGDTSPIRRPPYKTHYALRDEMKTEFEKMLQGVIRESESPWSSPAILALQKNLDGKPKYRFFVDFCALNFVTKFNPYTLPAMDEAASTLFGAKYFSVLDCFSGFLQVGIKECHRERTAFTVPSGHYEFMRLPFGLVKNPANFQRLMDTVLKKIWSTQSVIFTWTIVSFSLVQQRTMLEG